MDTTKIDSAQPKGQGLLSAKKEVVADQKVMARSQRQCQQNYEPTMHHPSEYNTTASI